MGALAVMTLRLTITPPTPPVMGALAVMTLRCPAGYRRPVRHRLAGPACRPGALLLHAFQAHQPQPYRGPDTPIMFLALGLLRVHGAAWARSLDSLTP